jgi:hypothetical protein
LIKSTKKLQYQQTKIMYTIRPRRPNTFYFLKFHFKSFIFSRGPCYNFKRKYFWPNHLEKYWLFWIKILLFYIHTYAKNET